MPVKFSTIKLSRSSLKLFQDCPRCFWLEMHHKLRRPPSLPYTLNAAVDFLVKQEFDKYRKAGTLPPVFARHNFKAKLFADPRLADWRDTRKGVQYFDEDLNATLYGAVDDVLEFPDTSLAVIDYKSTGSREIRVYDDYQKQMEIYSWLLSRNGFATHPEAYFVYYQVDKSGGGFTNVLPFIEQLKAVNVDTSWVGDVFEQAVMVARRDTPPEIQTMCEHCMYVQKAGAFFKSTPTGRSKKPASPEFEPVILAE